MDNMLWARSSTDGSIPAIQRGSLLVLSSIVFLDRFSANLSSRAPSLNIASGRLCVPVKMFVINNYKG
jgi:hypothetical protein